MSAANSGITQRLHQVVERAGGAYTVARELGVTPAAVYGWRAGTIPYRRTLAKLCALYRVRERWLIDGIGPMESTAPTLATVLTATEPDALAKTDDALAKKLAAMILGFDALPAAYEQLELLGVKPAAIAKATNAAF